MRWPSAGTARKMPGRRRAGNRPFLLGIRPRHMARAPWPLVYPPSPGRVRRRRAQICTRWRWVRIRRRPVHMRQHLLPMRKRIQINLWHWGIKRRSARMARRIRVAFPVSLSVHRRRHRKIMAFPWVRIRQLRRSMPSLSVEMRRRKKGRLRLRMVRLQSEARPNRARSMLSQ